MTATASESAQPVRSVFRSKLLWIGALYFASGFPYGLITDLLPVYFRVHGVGLAEIGLLSLAGLPWVAKPLWAPLVDRFGERKHWIASTQFLSAVLLLVMLALPADTVSTPLAMLLFSLAMLSATQDIAIDAYTIELLEEREIGPANGMRVTAYRLALIIAGGTLVGIGGRVGWNAAFGVGAAIIALLGVITLLSPSTERVIGERQPIWEPVRALLARPYAWAIVIFALTFKIGDSAMLPMIRPFWVDRGFSPEEIGFLITTVQMLATIAGAILGGLLTARWGTFRALWLLGLAQALSNLGYVAAASFDASRSLVYGAAVLEQFTGGLGTAAFLTYLMTICEKRFAATQYALLSALFGLGRLMVGAQSGVLAESVGYARFFLITFALALPAFALLPWVRKSLERRRLR